jgi:uncharacterized protein YndB with AHSA1/START domain
MKTVHAQRDIAAPIEQVFEILSDHANYSKFPGVKSSKLIQHGKPDKNGVGAQREIDAGKAWFIEEITAFERPVRMDYRIVKSRPPLAHEGGSIRLTRTAAGTHVDWTSTFRVDIPLIGGLLTFVLGPQIEKAFGSMLKETERRLAA